MVPILFLEVDRDGRAVRFVLQSADPMATLHMGRTHDVERELAFGSLDGSSAGSLELFDEQGWEQVSASELASASELVHGS